MRSFAVLLSAVALGPMLPGCPQAANNTNGNDEQLTVEEQNAVNTALSSSTSLTSATTTVQSTAGIEAQSGLDAPGSISFGTCPAVNLAAGASSGSFNMTIDFGTAGCSPFGADNATFSGSASGTFDQNTKMIEVQFSNLTYNDQQLSGDAALAYTYSSTSTQLIGDWNLSYGSDGNFIDTEGEGAATFTQSTKATNITTFTGTISEDGQTYAANMTGVQVSYQTYGNFVPFAGSISVSGTGIRSFRVKFSTNSPSTGIVQVSIEEGAFFDVDLSDL